MNNDALSCDILHDWTGDGLNNALLNVEIYLNYISNMYVFATITFALIMEVV